jgi:GNAT superfamily N-acetyltransferase
MLIKIQEIGTNLLPQYAKIPMILTVESVFLVEPIDGGLGGIKLREEKVVTPYLKNYDSYGDGPEEWPKRFDTHNWGVFLALKEDLCIGGAAVAFNTPGLHMLNGRNDLAIIWDIRVHPDFQGRGIGTKLFNHAVEWARKRGCKQLKIETQNVNVPACRFYAKQGCQLGEINCYGYIDYPEVEHEVMLIWYLNL